MSEVRALSAANDRAESSSWERPTLTMRLVTLLTIIIPFGGVLSGPFLVWGWGFGWTDLSLLIGMYVLSSLGVTVGFHRLFAHRSFDTFTWMKFIWAVFGSMAVEGPLFGWVGLHRQHHQFSDTAQDPHSPQHGGRGVLGLMRGFWHAHIGWFFGPKRLDRDRYVADLRASRALRVASYLFPIWVALGLATPAVLVGAITRTWNCVWTGLIWGGLVRVFVVHHVTWSVNSACHLWGSRPYKSHDESRNNVVFGILAMGEGWHNNHHAFPTSARHGLQWWQIDVSYYVIRAMASLHLAWDVKQPSTRTCVAAREASTSPHA